MKSIFILLCLVAFAFGQYGQNLITNGSFETFSGTIDDDLVDSFTGWTTANTGSSNGKIEAVSNPYQGVVGVEMSNLAAQPRLMSASIVTNGEQYRARLWVKTDGSDNFLFSVRNITDANYVYSPTLTGITATEYTKYDNTFTSPSGSKNLQ